jgi:hypothetical protein
LPAAVGVGLLFNHIAATGAAELNIASALVAALTGAAVLLATSHAFRDTRYRRCDTGIQQTHKACVRLRTDLRAATAHTEPSDGWPAEPISTVHAVEN